MPWHVLESLRSWLPHLPNVALVAFIPLLMAGIGTHLATEELRGKPTKRRLVIWTVWGCFVLGIACGILVEILNARADTRREQEAVEQRHNLGEVQKQNTAILQLLAKPLSESARRQGILDGLRNEWILHNNPVDQTIVEGKTYPPSEWMNARLKVIGEFWTVSPPPLVKRVPSPRSYIVEEGSPTHPGEVGGANVEFRPGDLPFFNITFRASGPDQVKITYNASVLHFTSDVLPSTLKPLVATFQSKVAETKGRFSTKDPGQSYFISAVLENDEHAHMTQEQLNDLQAGRLFAVVIAEVVYLDGTATHHERSCKYLQPPAALKNPIWHGCDVQFPSD